MIVVRHRVARTWRHWSGREYEVVQTCRKSEAAGVECGQRYTPGGLTTIAFLSGIPIQMSKSYNAHQARDDGAAGGTRYLGGQRRMNLTDPGRTEDASRDRQPEETDLPRDASTRMGKGVPGVRSDARRK